MKMKFFVYILLFVLVIVETFASVCDEIAWVSRAEWGARNATESPVRMPDIPVHHVFIHHTYEPDQCHNQTQCIKAMKSIQNYHIDSRKWDDIGYNFLMGGDDRIYVGRDWYAIGHHTLGINNRSIAISLIGNYQSVAPPKPMLDLTQKWIACAVEHGVLTSDYQLHGHRDQRCTECPGQRLYDIIKTWKQYSGKLDSYVCPPALD